MGIPEVPEGISEPSPGISGPSWVGAEVSPVGWEIPGVGREIPVDILEPTPAAPEIPRIISAASAEISGASWVLWEMTGEISEPSSDEKFVLSQIKPALSIKHVSSRRTFEKAIHTSAHAANGEASRE